MRFGPVPLAEAGGAILAHAVDVPGGVLRKGTVLGPEALAALAAAGRGEVICARLEAGDLGEDIAAARLAGALAGAGLRLTAATTGRVNLHATGPGVVGIDVARIEAVNAVNPLITVATVAPFARMEAGGMVATIKIIAWGVPEADLARACAAAGAGALRLDAPVLRTASLIETVVTRREPAPKGRQALIQRLARLGVELGPRVVVPHEAGAVARALGAAAGEVVFVLTASATSDPGDVGPEAVRQAGGEIVQVGIPVDPGNLLFLGHLGGRVVIGLPGCARSPALNGADFVMERVICGVPVGPGDLARMGVGGLLKEIPLRGRLRDAGAIGQEG
jgi:molybdenum cofactor cytidylyltransferase